MRNLVLVILIALACATSSRGQTSAPAWDPPPITLQLSGVSPQDAFRQLGELVGLTFQPYNDNLFASRPASIDVDIKEQPFWLAVKQVCDASHIELHNDSQPAARLGEGDRGLWSNAIAVSSGPVVFVLTGLQRTTKVDLRQPNKITRRADLGITTFIDPRVRTAQGSRPLVVTEATDDKGQKLKHANPDSSGTFQNAWSINQNLALDLPVEPGRKIAKITGDAHFLMDVKTESLEIKLPMTEKITRRIGGFPLVLSDVRKEGTNWRAKISYNRTGGDKSAYERLRPAFEDWTRRLELQDEAGQPFRRGGWSGMSSNDERSVELQLEPPTENGDAVKLVWAVPVEVKDVAIPFEFTDLPLEESGATETEKKSDG